jgi:hypothetical protein
MIEVIADLCLNKYTSTNSLTGTGVFSRPDDASCSLALACFNALMYCSLLCCLGAYQPKTYL